MFRDLNDIRLFAEVCRQGAVTRGARALALPPATVSRRLAALEREVGERLVERNARHFRLTDTGQAYFAAALRMLEDLEAASAEVSRLVGTPSGSLRIAAPPDFATFFLAEPIAAFCAKYPQIAVALDLSTRRVDLIEEGFDLAVRIGTLQDSRLVSRPLAHLSRGLYAGSAYAAAQTLPRTPEDLDTGQLLILDANLMQRELVLYRGEESRTLALDGHIRTNSIAMLRQFVLAGAGIAVLPDALLANELAGARVVRVLPEWRASSSQAHLLYRGRALLPQRVRLMVEHLGAWFEASRFAAAAE